MPWTAEPTCLNNKHEHRSLDRNLRPELPWSSPIVPVGTPLTETRVTRTYISTTQTSRSVGTSANIETLVLSFMSYNDVVCVYVFFLLFHVS